MTNRFFLFWVLFWMPVNCIVFLLLSDWIASMQNNVMTGAAFLIYAYSMFGPAIYAACMKRGD
ncbi:MAG: hypothetical protein ACRYGK_00460 [Janthinobacterium lividum]